MTFLSDLATATGWPTTTPPETPGKVPPASNLLDRVFPLDQLDEDRADVVLRLPVYGSWTT